MCKIATKIAWCLSIALISFAGVYATEENLLSEIGTFSSGEPHLWNAEPGNSGATLTWATDEAHTPPRSLKIEKPNTSDEGARWITDGKVRFWNPIVPAEEDIKVGAFVKTEGVNTDPANEDEKWQLKFWFYNADDELIGGQPFILDIDQSVASRDWYADTNSVGSLMLPEPAAEWFVSAEAGPNATGTVWFDTFIFHSRVGWAGEMFNHTTNADRGWFFWIAQDWGTAPYVPVVTAGVTTEEYRSGGYSLKIDAPVGRYTGEALWASETVPIPPGSEGKQYVLSAWMKTENIIPDSIFNDIYSLGFTATWHPKGFDDMKGEGWVMERSDDFPQFYLRREEGDWRELVWVYTVPSDDVEAVSLRLRHWHEFTGTVYWDDVTLAPLSEDNLLSEIGTFSSGEPHLWNAEPGNSGATLTWATDEAHTPPRSLKIEKPNTSDEGARWITDGKVRFWNPIVPAEEDIKVGAFVKTEGVNTDPANEDEKWQLKFWFYNADDELIGGQPFILDIDQSVASRDWYADTNSVGSLMLPEPAAEWFVSAEAGPNATGTVWFDTFIFHSRVGWAGEMFNHTTNADRGWFFWIAQDWGTAPYVPVVTAGVTTEEYRSGGYSLKIDAPVGRYTGEALWASETVPIPPGSEGKQYVLSAWMKTENIIPDSIFNDIYSLGFTATWHPKGFDDMKGEGWVMERSDDFPQFYLRREEGDWSQLIWKYTVPSDDVEAVSLRLRHWHEFTGTVYWDDIAFHKVEGIVVSVDDDRDGLITETIPNEYRLLQNYPNPFNPMTTIEYHLPEATRVTVEVYNLLGQRVKTLVDEYQNAGRHRVVWNSRNEHGQAVSSGVYIYRLHTEQTTLTQKMLFLK